MLVEESEAQKIRRAPGVSHITDRPSSTPHVVANSNYPPGHGVAPSDAPSKGSNRVENSKFESRAGTNRVGSASFQMNAAPGMKTRRNAQDLTDSSFAVLGVGILYSRGWAEIGACRPPFPPASTLSTHPSLTSSYPSGLQDGPPCAPVEEGTGIQAQARGRGR